MLFEAKRQDREQLDQLGKHVQKGVVRPENDRRTKNRDVQLIHGSAHQRLTLALRAQVLGWRVERSLERAHVDQATNPAFPHRGDDLPRQIHMCRSEALAVGQARIAVVQNADQIDHRILSLHQLGEDVWIMNVGLDHADSRQHDELLGVFPMTGRYRHPHATFRKATGNPTADKTTTANQQHVLEFHSILPMK